jgi:hypothetical protein
MTDELELLKDLPRHAPSDALRREVRVAALARFEAVAKRPWWHGLVDQLAIPLALAAVSAIYLVWAAEHTPLFR